MNAPDVVVVGGGFAGLSAATALAEQGAGVCVIEARPHLGGRATAYRDAVTGERIDNGQHVLAGCYDETLRFLRRIGTVAALRRPSTLDVILIDEDGSRHQLRLPPLPSPFHLLGGVLAWHELTWRERVAMLRMGPVLHALSRRAATAGDETVRAWLRRHDQPERLCRLFWEPLALATLNQSIDVAGAAPFLAVVGRMIAGGPDAATLLLPASPLDELYAKPAREFLRARGSRCVLGCPARVRIEGPVVRGVLVGDEVVQAPVVIAAVPWFALRSSFERPPDVLEPLLVDAGLLASSPIVTVNVWFDRAVMDHEFVGLPGRTFQWVFDKSRIVDRRLSHLSLVSSGADAVVALDKDALSARALDELRAALPRAREAEVRRITVIRERRATFSLAPGMPRRPPTCTEVDGLLLAGDWIDTGLPATIESAVVAGHRAAAAAVERLRH